MLKKSITYENPFTGTKRTEDFFFHISKAAIIRMDVEENKETYVAADGEELAGMRAKMQRIVEAKDGKALMPLFEDIIRRSYGRKDGDRFIQTEESWADFKGSGAFDELLFELCTDAEASADFINGAMPGNLEQLAAEMQAEAKAKPKAKAKASAKKPAAQAELEAEGGGTKGTRATQIANATTEKPVTLTQEEMVAMEPEDLQTGLASGKFKLV